MSKEILTFGDIEIEKKFFFTAIRLLFLLKMQILRKYQYLQISFGEKTINTLLVICIMYNDHNVKALHIMLPKTSAYVKIYDEQIKWMYFLIKNYDLLEKYDTIQDRVSADINDIKIEFDRQPVYSKEFLKTKIKSQGDEIADFYDKEIHKVDSNHTCLAVITLDWSVNTSRNK